MKQFLYILSLITLSFGAAQAQEGSRLNVGSKPKMPVMKSEINNFVVSNVTNGINIDKEKSVSEFYRQLLIIDNKKTKAPVAAAQKVSFNNKEMEEALFSNDVIVVSNVYPNPADDYANFEYYIKNSSTKATIIFNDLIGSQKTSLVLDRNDRKVNISTRNWENGMYFYQLVVDGKKVATRKLLVRHN